MHDLIAKYFSKEITSEEKKILFEELKKDPELRKDFETLQNVYGITSFIPANEDEKEGKNMLRSLKASLNSSSHKDKRHSLYIHVFGYAAAILIAVVSTWLVQSYYYEKQSVVPQVYEEFQTPAGQRALLTLHDGTKVWLNSRSTLRYPNQFSKDERRVTLNGEAYFDVYKNEKQPFIVQTSKAEIKVLGTKFNVFSYDNNSSFITSLVEGSVSLYKNGEENAAMILRPYEKASLIDGKFSKTTFTNDDFLLWKDGIYYFDDVPFNELVNKLELYYEIKIIQKNNKLNNYRFSGKFRQRDGVENVLRALQKINHFSFVKDKTDDTITIY